MIDWARVSERRDEVGEEDFDEVVELFLEEVDEAIAALCDLTDLCKTCTAMPFFKRQRTEYRFPRVRKFVSGRRGRRGSGTGRRCGNCRHCAKLCRGARSFHKLICGTIGHLNQ